MMMQQIFKLVTLLYILFLFLSLSLSTTSSISYGPIMFPAIARNAVALKNKEKLQTDKANFFVSAFAGISTFFLLQLHFD